MLRNWFYIAFKLQRRTKKILLDWKENDDRLPNYFLVHHFVLIHSISGRTELHEIKSLLVFVAIRWCSWSRYRGALIRRTLLKKNNVKNIPFVYGSIVIERKEKRKKLREKNKKPVRRSTRSTRRSKMTKFNKRRKKKKITKREKTTTMQ